MRIPESGGQGPPTRGSHATGRSALVPKWLVYPWLVALTKVDFTPRREQPGWTRTAVATIVSLAGSLLADALLAKLGTSVFPSTKGYVHFQFHDYARLTVIGVLIACAAWPVMTRVTSLARPAFFRAAVLVTLALWLPDLYILAKGQPAKAVAVLMVMHLAIALITYNALVGIASPAEPRRQS
ncbi:MAG TPA: DUF6069 family protein [Acidimicrobiales bacterium]|nr:DUF6069 family protein [Acidimicrobiales bacterium]